MLDVRVQSEDFDMGAEYRALSARAGDCGAVASFCGLMRADDGVTAMHLEHYPAMTHKMLQAIAQEATQRWPLAGITLIHRVGRFVPGAQIVLVLTAARHRSDALDACHFLIDWLKTRAPFWKREERNGSQHWVEARHSDDAAAARWDSR